MNHHFESFIRVIGDVCQFGFAQTDITEPRTFNLLNIEVQRELEREAIDQAREKARSLGYLDEQCPDCHSWTLVRNGTCKKCCTCGATCDCN